MFKYLFSRNRKDNNDIVKKEYFCNNLYIKDNLSDKEKFENIINFAKEIIDKHNNENSHEHPILDFIRILGRRIQSDYMGYLLYSGKRENESSHLEAREVMFSPYKSIKDENNDYIEISDLIEKKQSDKKINLSKDLVLPWPWRRERIRDCLLSIGEGRKSGIWKQDYDNHYVDVWLPIGIAWVYGGNHSITVGIVQGGELEPNYYSDISKVYKYIKCDGESFIDINSGRSLCKVKSPEFAAIFEIGRMMVDNNISFID